ncbi:Twitching mobility protein [Ferriphaselus amnicola]|uniref:Twitching mobility protein n=1 Tax=Ferriphaselus amnicola TaxID=1188319 RepID=A0A2Z6G8V8_9PROT|nr:PilT/PilU family type 4a pilus ATPase [Ferriphaselus amnicola]BBE49825.1 Twitching mobility protein [Ferriphaselus amnicola]
MDRVLATELIHSLLRQMLARKASDLFITAGFPPALKIDGVLTPLLSPPLSAADTQDMANCLMSPRQSDAFETTHECNFAISPPEIGRFRVNVFLQQMNVGMVLRTITTQIPSVESLNLPPILKDIVMSKRGLVILVGATGSGKSTTLAAMVGHRNEFSHGHIVTVEDPVEFVHEHRNCIVTHREIGIDTESWLSALKNAMRQAPDVILIGEIRDREAMEYAISFAETGHLCLATLHANNADQAIDRIVSFYPEERHEQVLMSLSLNLKSLISQRLVPRKNSTGRIAAMEILLNSPLIADLIFKGEINEIKAVMSKSRELGMQTFDQALFTLFDSDLITYEEALKNADSLNDLRLRIKLESKAAKDNDLMSGIGHLKLT